MKSKFIFKTLEKSNFGVVLDKNMTTFVAHGDISKSALPVPVRITRPSDVNQNLGYFDLLPIPFFSKP